MIYKRKVTCSECGAKFKDGRGLAAHNRFKHRKVSEKELTLDSQLYSEEVIAKRDPVTYRYDILDWDFLELMAKIAAYGAKKYGDLNWQQSRLKGEKGPMNHIMNHIRMYDARELYDHEEVGKDTAIHLAAIAFNAMMEYYYAREGM